LQLALRRLACFCIHPSDLLPRRMEIAAYNNHKKAPSSSRIFGPQPKDTLEFELEPSFLCNQPCSHSDTRYRSLDVGCPTLACRSRGWGRSQSPESGRLHHAHLRVWVQSFDPPPRS